MALKEKVKLYSTGIAIKGAMRVLPKISDETWLSLVRGRVYRSNNKNERDFLENLLVSLKHTIVNASPGVRKKVVMNLINNAMIQGQPKRKEFAKKYGINPPNHLVISPSMACNLKCFGCYAWKYQKKDELSYDICNRVIQEANDIGIYFFVITGGEPFYWEHLFDFLEKHNDCFFQIYTNGHYIDESAAKKLAQLGNAIVCISVEGFKEETDARRGPGAWDKIMKAMDLLRENRVLFGYSVTAVRSNNELIVSNEFFDFFIKKGCFLGWYFNYIPTGKDPDLNLMPTPKQRDYRRRRVLEVRRSKNIIPIDFWNDGPLVHGCMAGGKNYLHINVNGDVEPCVFIHFAVDNVKDKSLTEVITSDFFKLFRKRQIQLDNHLTPCCIIDNPHVLREAVTKARAYTTHEGAETMVTTLAKSLDEYGLAYKKIADKAWAEEYISKETEKKAI